jgi:hypothetical protein
MLASIMLYYLFINVKHCPEIAVVGNRATSLALPMMARYSAPLCQDSSCEKIS